MLVAKNKTFIGGYESEKFYFWGFRWLFWMFFGVTREMFGCKNRECSTIEGWSVRKAVKDLGCGFRYWFQIFNENLTLNNLKLSMNLNCIRLNKINKLRQILKKFNTPKPAIINRNISQLFSSHKMQKISKIFNLQAFILFKYLTFSWAHTPFIPSVPKNVKANMLRKRKHEFQWDQK